jgi:gamma-glutamylcyclotransferase (GGCT)/AIG2-like uncharacterized protein YtfP
VTADLCTSEGHEDGSELVFVYGTLRRNASEGARMSEAKYVGRRLVKGALYEIASRPALVESADANSSVLGDLYRVHVDRLAEIDRWHEGEAGMTNGGGYARAKEAVSQRHETRSHTAWVWRWIGPTDAGVAVPSGDWLDVEQPRTLPLFTCMAVVAAAGSPILMEVAIEVESSINTNAGYGLLGSIIVLGAASPFIGCLAYYFAERRREKWLGFRFVVLAVLLLECLPGAFILVTELGGLTGLF